MKILAGQFKGQKLCSFTSKRIRPMTARVKTSVFDVLNTYINFSTQTVLDLFSGTGNLAFEALSRGAKKAYLVDSGRSFISLARKNAHLLKINKKIVIYSQDVFYFLSKKNIKDTNEFSLIFADPPFSKKWGTKILNYIENFKAAKNDAIFVLEISSKEDSPPSTKHYHLFTEKQFSDKKVLFYERRGFDEC